LDWSWESVGDWCENRAQSLFKGLHGGRSIAGRECAVWMAYREIVWEQGSRCV
jgi:hypothetical protein